MGGRIMAGQNHGERQKDLETEKGSQKDGVKKIRGRIMLRMIRREDDRGR
jgi:hypothetical protein